MYDDERVSPRTGHWKHRAFSLLNSAHPEKKHHEYQKYVYFIRLFLPAVVPNLGQARPVFLDVAEQ